MQIEIKREQHIDTEKIEWHIDTEKKKGRQSREEKIFTKPDKGKIERREVKEREREKESESFRKTFLQKARRTS